MSETPELKEEMIPMVEDFLNSRLAKIHAGKRRDVLIKLHHSLEFLKNNHLNLILVKKQNMSSTNWSVGVFNEADIILGYFEIECNNVLGTLQLGISTIEEDDGALLKGKGIARLMIATMCLKLEREGKISKFTQLYIDADASGGFWDAIGMAEHRYANFDSTLRDLEGKGEEKSISFGHLTSWALGEIMGDATKTIGACGILTFEPPTGGRKKNKTRRKFKKTKRHYKKSRKSNKFKKSRKSKK